MNDIHGPSGQDGPPPGTCGMPMDPLGEPGGLKGADGSARFDYDRQAWVQKGRYIRCGHPEDMGCDCYGKLHEGEPAG